MLDESANSFDENTDLERLLTKLALFYQKVRSIRPDPALSMPAASMP
jgi:hypothetical protein